MKRTSLFLVGACVLLASDPPRKIESGFAELGNGIGVRYSTYIEPPLKNSQILLLGSGVSSSNGRVHRTMVDKTSRTYIGYDISIEPTGAPGAFRVTIEPLTGTDTVLRAIAGDLPVRPAGIPKYPAPQTVREGDTIALDVLVSPDGKQKLVDYLEVVPRLDPPPAKSTGAPRDFTLDDGPLRLQFQSPTGFFIDGRKFAGRVGFTVMRVGSTIWFAPPDRGRYILSLQPREGFRKAGTIRDNVLSFEDAGVQYEYRASSPILGEGNAWNLYLLRDPQYQPKAADPPAVFGGVDRLDNLLRGSGPLEQMLRRIEEMRRQDDNEIR
jgi:hypothetical protein